MILKKAILCVDDEQIVLRSLRDQINKHFGNQFFPHIITVMLTGNADKAAIQRVRQEGDLLTCLSRPWSESTLIETIISGLEKYDG
ncbi:MAG: hypothetical protein AAGF26_20625 [Cyanobacteria bacterium P01_G01_bin.49]